MSMRIAEVAPLLESVPPQFYGGTERVVRHLTEELVSLGHHVTLFASGDSTAGASLLVPICPRALWLEGDAPNIVEFNYELLFRMLQARIHTFDVVHCHLYHQHHLARVADICRRAGVAMVTTMHNRVDAGPFCEQPTLLCGPYIAISDDQRSRAELDWVSTIHHGFPLSLYHRSEGSGDERGQYLAFLGSIRPGKGVEAAIRIAILASMRLKIAAKITEDGREYYESIKHLLEHPLIELIPPIGDAEKQEFLGNAAALLFPIDWPEPFGLVMIEAMACGCPVIAYESGSVPEVIEQYEGQVRAGVVIRQSVHECRIRAAARFAAVAHTAFDRSAVRAAFEERFTSGHMAQKHAELFQETILAHRPSRASTAQRIRSRARVA
jgi:glycosyltransferase involved in cell wall biosynthesis